MDYSYEQSIGSSDLRLLQVVTVSQQRLAFKLLRVARTAAPSYTAVSYTWGDDAPSETIIIDGGTFHVRPNLWSCLYYLGSASGRSVCPYLWVDAICIDQKNDKERSDQVRYMDQTYRDATSVSVWLGLIPVPDEYRRLSPRHVPIRTFEADPWDWDDSIDDLANRTYWSRYWVIQEFLLGKNVQLHCSNNQIDWEDFQELLCREADIVQFGAEHIGILPDDKAAACAALPLTLGRHIDKYPDFLQPLADLLVRHRRSMCKDPRDRIFALLGLVSTDERELLNRFLPDYTLSENDVRVVALAHLMQYGYLSNPALENITPDSEDIFIALGVDLKSERKVLISRSRRLDYLGHWRPGELSRMLEAGDVLDFPTDVNEDELDGPAIETWPGRGDYRWAKWRRRIVSLGVTAIITLLLYYRNGDPEDD